MARTSPLTASLSTGEISPRLAARLDFVKYPSSLETGVNVIPWSEGALTRRAGFRFVAELKSSAVMGRLKPFQFSTTQAYQIEAGEQAFRFYRHQAQIIVADTDGAIANGTFPSGITDWDDRSTGGGSIAHDATNDRMSLVPGGTGLTDIGWAEQDVTIGAGFTAVEHVVKFQVTGAPSDRIELAIGTTSTGTELVAGKIYEVGYHCVAFTPGATIFYIQFRNRGDFRNKTVQIDNVSLIDNAAVEVQTPYAEADLFQIDGPQSADVLYLYSGTYPTYKLQRLGHTSWSLVEVAWIDGPYLTQNASTTTLTPSAATGLGINLTLSAVTGVNNDRGWLSSDIGRLVRYQKANAGAWGYAVIISITSTTVAVGDVREAFQATPTAATSFRLGAWSGTTGYPSAATFYQQRLVSGNTTHDPQTFSGSQTSDFENMTPDNLSGTVEDDDSYTYTISSDTVNAIHWFRASKSTLVIGTTGGTWTVASTGSVVTPNDINVEPGPSQKSADIEPLRIGNIVLFVQRAKRKVREFGFDFQVDGFQAFDMTRLAQHITRGGIVEMAYAEEPDSLVWAVRGDGTLLSMTFRREEDVVGWARHVMGGSFGAGSAVVESVSVIPGATGAGQVQSSEDRDEVWVIVKRTINGATKRYIEVLERDWEKGDDREDDYQSDSLITYDGAATGTLSGLGHLEGETVKVLADGAVHPDLVVASASVTLDASTYTVVQAGLGFTHTIKPLKIIAGTARGTPVGKTKQVFEATFVLLNSHTIAYGPDSDNLKHVDFREVADLMDTALPAFTGEFVAEWDDDWKTDPRMVIQSDDPVSFTLLGLVPEVDVKEVK